MSEKAREQFLEANEVKAKDSYDNILGVVQSKVKSGYSELIANKDADDAKGQLLTAIQKVLVDENIGVEGIDPMALTERIYNDMAGSSFLHKYIYETPGVEEVNINRWDDVTITRSGGKPEKIPERFASPQQAVDIVKRLLQTQHITIDDMRPSVLSYLSEGVRICANIAPVVSKDAAVSASIRIVKTEDVTLDTIEQFGTATHEMLQFLRLCVKDHVSCCISGSVGAGKTTTLAAMLEQAKYTDRVITIEEGSREFALLKRDAQGNIINNVLSKLTRDSDNPDLVIDQEDLLEHCLRENPDIMGIGEMRSAEAYTVAEAARTGTATYTTTHASNAIDTYKRLMELSYKKYPMEFSFLMRQMIDAFPIIVHQKRFPDGSRRIIEILEGVRFNPETESVEGNMLYKFVVEDNIDDEDGNIAEVRGHFEKVHNMSKSLYERFLSNGATTTKLAAYIDPTKTKEGTM